MAARAAETVEQRAYRTLIQLIDEVALHDAPDFDPDAWRRLAQTFEGLLDEHFRGLGQREDPSSPSLTEGKRVNGGARLVGRVRRAGRVDRCRPGSDDGSWSRRRQ